MDFSDQLFFDMLRTALRNSSSFGFVQLSDSDCRSIQKAGYAHGVLPLVADAIWNYHSSDLSSACRSGLRRQAKELAVRQAYRTAEFMLLYQRLCEKGLQPIVMKGIICRNLYPKPELRASTDEDLLIRREELPHYRKELLSYGLIEESISDDEITFTNQARGLIIELHLCPFPQKADAYGDCNRFFADTTEHTESVKINEVVFHTFCPTDHLLYMLLHMYKHFLYGGFGIRQICDTALFTEQNSSKINWQFILSCCREQKIDLFTAAVFRIAENYLGFSMPEIFQNIITDEKPLLEDILSGGLYGVNDINRAHSANITLDAVAAHKQGRIKAGVLRSLFPGKEYLQSQFSYAKVHPFLLPVAWTHRIFRYLRNEKGSTSAETIRIGKKRVELLKIYGIITR